VRHAEDKNFRYVIARTGVRGRILGQQEGSAVRYRELGCGYAVIDGQVHFNLDPVAGADTDSFEPLIVLKTARDCEEGWYGRDRERVYYRASPMPDVDVSSFSAFCYYRRGSGIEVFAHDKKARYRAGRALEPPAEPLSWPTVWNERFEEALASWESSGKDACCDALISTARHLRAQ
jgi:hypothetical protein